MKFRDPEKYRKLDNTTKREKIALRIKALRFLSDPVVMETNGGLGNIWRACYAHLDRGVVFETDETKAGALSMQRPTWAVYQADCVGAIGAGVGFHLPINYIDLDPYGSPWLTIQAIFSQPRAWGDRLVLVANDGYRLAIKIDGGKAGVIAPYVDQYGSGPALFHHYLDVCQDFIKTQAEPHGFILSHWAGYYCGFTEQMTHYAAVLDRSR